MLELASYDQVAVDVIAGTSAGGLNGALLTSHLVYGMPFDNNVSDIWLRLVPRPHGVILVDESNRGQLAGPADPGSGSQIEHGRSGAAGSRWRTGFSASG